MLALFYVYGRLNFTLLNERMFVYNKNKTGKAEEV